MNHKIILLTLLSVIYCIIVKAHEEILSDEECSSCRMPCIMSNPSINRTALIRAYTTTYKGYRITTLLNGIQGYFQTTVTLNDKDAKVYSARINLEYWPFSGFCKILSHTPTIVDPKKQNVLSVRYKTYESFNVHLKVKLFGNYLQYLLIEKVAKVQNDVDIKNKLYVDVKNELSNTFENLKKTSRLKYAIRNADVSGNTKMDIFKSPSNSTSLHSHTDKGKWLFIDLKEEFIFNHFRFRLWDGDSRSYTYTIQVSQDNTVWKEAIKKTGKSVQNLQLPELMNIRYIRMEGTNPIHQGLHLLYFHLKLE